MPSSLSKLLTVLSVGALSVQSGRSFTSSASHIFGTGIVLSRSGLDSSSTSPVVKSASSVADRRLGMVRNLFESIFGKPPGPPSVNYDELEGAAKEAAEFALAGEVPAKTKDGLSIATFAGGCFWGLELAFQRVPGVVGTAVGYTQGSVERPAYGPVCTGGTGHTEAVLVTYKPNEVSYKGLLGVFFGRINPTTVNGQGNDYGTQYRTGVYTHTAEQMKEAQEFFPAVQAHYTKAIATELKPAMIFWPAEKYHQQYLEKGGRFKDPQSAAKGCTDTIRCYG